MKPKVLIVEDTATTAELLNGILENQGITESYIIASGLEALDWLLENTPDLIFLDVKMPGMDGWLLCEILSNVKRWKKIPVILQTGIVGRENIKKGLSLGAHSYIEKPLNAEKVSAVLTAVMRPPVVLPSGLNRRQTIVVNEVAGTTKQTFNLVLGEQTYVQNIQKLSEAPISETFDYVGCLTCDGAARIEISVGWSRELCTQVTSAFLGMPLDEIEEEFRTDAIREILNLMVGTTFKAITGAYAVKLGVPETLHDSSPPRFPEAQLECRIDFKAGDHDFPLALAIIEND